MKKLLKAFGIKNPTILRKLTRSVTLEIMLRELVQNAIEAQSETIELSPSGQNKFRCFDDGIGMTLDEMKEYFGDLGVGAKLIGPGDNFGAGMKLLCYSHQMGVTFTSRKRGTRSTEPTYLVLGEGEDPETKGLITYGQVDYGKGGTLGEKWSTSVELNGIEFDPVRALQAVNGRYLSLPKKVRVRFPKGHGNEEWRRAEGLDRCFETCVKRVYRHELEHCIFMWGQRKDPRDKELRDLIENEWCAPTLNIAWQGECFDTFDGLKAAKVLENFGIYAVTGEVICLVIAKGKDIEWNGTRTGLENWDRDKAAAELRHKLEVDQEPRELFEFMEVMEAQHSETNQEFDDAIRAAIENLELSAPPRKHLDDDGEDEFDDHVEEEDEEDVTEDEEGEDGGRPKPPGKKRHRKGSKAPRQRRGLPKVVPGDGTLTAGEPIHLDARQNKLYINFDHELYAFLKKLRGTEKTEHKKAIGVSVLTSFGDYRRLTGKDPETEQLRAFACGNFVNRIKLIRKTAVNLGSIFRKKS